VLEAFQADFHKTLAEALAAQEDEDDRDNESAPALIH
jgi:hypothetical protein